MCSSCSAAPVSRTVLVLGSLWALSLMHACAGEELSRGLVLSWVRGRVLDGLGLEEPPLIAAQGRPEAAARPGARPWRQRTPRRGRSTRGDVGDGSEEDSSQIILFPSSDPTCTASNSTSGPISITYHFQPSINKQDGALTFAHFWFHAGEGAAANSSSSLFLLTATQSVRAAEAPSSSTSDGWATFHLDRKQLAPLTEGPLLLQVRCAGCLCRAGEQDKTPFLHLRVHPRGPVRPPRHAALTIPWSPSAVHVLQRPSQERPERGDCQRAAVDISFQELGWDNWIVHPEALTFYYCHGNCSAAGRAAALLGITQCCAPVPGTMKSVRITTTSDGGYSFKYETLPNIIPEECACI